MFFGLINEFANLPATLFGGENAGFPSRQRCRARVFREVLLCKGKLQSQHHTIKVFDVTISCIATPLQTLAKWQFIKTLKR
jgi:hypothetical protein